MPSITVGRDELVGLAARVGRLDRRARRRRHARPPRGRWRRSRARRAPSAGRGPSPSSARRRTRSARRDARRQAAASSSRTNPSAERRRRVAAVEQRVDADRRHALVRRHARPARAGAGRGRGRRPGRRGRRCAGGRSRAPAPQAASSAGRSKNEPSRDRRVDARQVLEHRAARAEVEVPDLRVAHLARGQADGALGCLQHAVRPPGEQLSPARHRCRGDRVGRRVVPDPETVEDHEHDGPRPAVARHGRRIRLGHPARPRAAAVIPARATMPAISSGLSDAPPTSAPSMAGSARNSPMFADVTLPP